MPSTAIDRFAYDPDTRELKIWFRSGRAYAYLEVPETEYEELMNAPSKGRFVNFRIKPFYEVREIIPPPGSHRGRRQPSAA